MKKYVKASEVNDPKSAIDQLILQLNDMVKFAQDINEAIDRNGGEVRDTDELIYDVDDIIFDLKGIFNSMGEMAEWQKIFRGGKKY